MSASASNVSPPDLDRLRRLSAAGPRYTSYPTAASFTEEFGPADYARAIAERNAAAAPVSLYFHIPFCENICLYCACSVVYTANKKRAAPYLELLKREIDLTASRLDSRRSIEQLHLGGGTPTFLAPDELRALMSAVRDRFAIAPDAEISIELDPRVTSDEHVAALAECGFTRASLGVQDFDPAVQAAIHRIQPAEQTTRLIETLRVRGFGSVNIDLIYGLPKQNLASFQNTVRGALQLRPERISLFHFAYLPGVVKHQERINAADLPETDVRLSLFEYATRAFLEAGYVYIGMDHFALPDDELARARERGELHRNFQGYTTRGDCDLYGLGLTSIGDLKIAYAQNAKKMDEYTRRIEAGELATVRGYRLNRDDLIRRAAIMELICQFELRVGAFEAQWDLNFADYFAAELGALRELEADGLVELHPDRIQISSIGRFAVRNICMAFDAHLSGLAAKGQKFSRTI